MPFQVLLWICGGIEFQIEGGASTLYSGQSVKNFCPVIQTLILQILITTRWTKNSGKRQINKDMSILRTEATS